MNRKLSFSLHRFILNLLVENSIVLYAFENLPGLEKSPKPSTLFASKSFFIPLKQNGTERHPLNSLSAFDDLKIALINQYFPGWNGLRTSANYYL